MGACFIASLRFVHKWQVSKEIQIIDLVYIGIVIKSCFEVETTHILKQKSYRYFSANIGHKKNGRLADQPSLLCHHHPICSSSKTIEIYRFDANTVAITELPFVR